MEENNITVDKAVQTIKGAILRAQAQASQSSNAIQLSLYYGIGRYVSINLQQAHWGAKALDSISERLQRELPGLRGFSSGNLKKMRIFYEEWQCLSIGSPLANQLQQLENKIEEGVEIGEKTLLCINRPIESADLRIEDFVGISFTHHMEILHKTTTLDERIYYIHSLKPYVSGMKNVRFRRGKHKKYKGITALLPNHFSIPPYLFFQSSPEKPE